MLPIIFGVLRSYAPYITLPVAALIGFIGYHVEGKKKKKKHCVCKYLRANADKLIHSSY